MGVKGVITQRLTDELKPVRLDVTDESALHAGHASAHPSGETHFRIRIVSAQFVGKRRVERHRMIYDLLAPEINAGLHAIAMTTLTPEESDMQQA